MRRALATAPRGKLFFGAQQQSLGFVERGRNRSHRLESMRRPYRAIILNGARLERQHVRHTEATTRWCTMPEKAVYLLVVEGFADWEPAHAVAELRRHGGFRVECVGLSGLPVRSMGGITVLPTMTVSDVNASDVAVFILPGGDRWENAPVEPALEELLNRLDASNVPIAAICGATVAISRIGLLRGRRHTSNGLDYLRSHVPGYADAEQYVNAPAVRDRRLITASGLGDVEFARELFEELEVLSADDRSLWAAMFRSGTA
jgi:putative intracellular protease/amidase